MQSTRDVQEGAAQEDEDDDELDEEQDEILDGEPDSQAQTPVDQRMHTPELPLHIQPRQSDFSPFPYVTLSPPSTRSSMPAQEATSPSIILAKREKLEQETSETKPLLQRSRETSSTATPSERRSITQPLSTSRGRSTTGFSTTTTTTTTTTTSTVTMGPSERAPRYLRHPTPPPPNDPLGPAAQYPYLPAEPDYKDGTTVYYSCRPSGPCLYDLLGTLPMKKFGILDWEILDREEEIYDDSDDVKEQYKVMHALWARWIMLHR